MKTFIKTTLFAACLFVSLFLFADSIPTLGTWDTKGVRTLVPPPPAAYIEGDTLSIYLAMPLSNLTVLVIDSEGNIVYQGSITSNIPDYTCNIQLAIPDGEYQLLLIHYYGALSGTFEIAE